jgi:hypothetical protein
MNLEQCFKPDELTGRKHYPNRDLSHDIDVHCNNLIFKDQWPTPIMLEYHFSCVCQDKINLLQIAHV